MGSNASPTFVDIDGDGDGDPLPAWIQIGAATGLVTGTPGFADRGTYALDVTATDLYGLSVSAPLTVERFGRT